MPRVHTVCSGLHAIDLLFQGEPGVIASYLLEESDELALLEIGPESSLERLLEGLDLLGISPNDISKVMVTHVHLDHAGAAGTFLRRFPRARLFAYALGVPHLVDPSKLVASASRIYGDMMGPLWGAIEPVPVDRITALADGDSVTVGSRTLHVVYTPGHASHHVVYHDADRSLLFTGDVAAVRLQEYGYIRPPTPPPDFDLEAWSNSLQRVRALCPETLCLTHFGPFTDVDAHVSQTRERLYAWAELVKQAMDRGRERDQMIDELQRFGDREIAEVSGDAAAIRRYELATPYYMTVDGLARYFRKRSVQ